MKRFLVLLLLLALCATANIHTIATITGTGAAVQVSTNVTTKCTWIQVTADSGNSANVFVGDSTVTSSRGQPVTKGNFYVTPTCDHCVYTLAATWVYIGNGDKIYVAYGD